MRLTLSECYRKRMLRKDRPDTGKARISIKISENKLAKAKKAFNSGIFEAVIIFAYTSMFHAARSLLFKDGIMERSHICLMLHIQ